MKRDLTLVAISMMVWGFGEGLFILFQPIYLEELGADPLLIGSILGLLGIAMTAAHLPAGYLSDRIGRRPMLISAWLLGTAAAWIMAISTSLGLFVVGSVLYAATAFVISPLNSYITAARGQLAVGRVLTLISAAYNFGAIGGPILGGWIGENFGLRYNFFISAVLFVISSLIILNIRSQPVELGKSESHPKNILTVFTPKFIRYLVVVFIVMFSLYLPQPLSQNFLLNERGLDLQNIGLLISARSAGVVILNLVLGSLSAPFGFLLSQTAMGVYTLLIGFGVGIPWYFIGYLLLGSYQTARSLSNALARSLMKASNMGFSYGTVEAVNSSAIILAPPIAGYLYTINPESVFTISFVLIGLAIIINLIFSPVKIKSIKSSKSLQGT